MPNKSEFSRIYIFDLQGKHKNDKVEFDRSIRLFFYIFKTNICSKKSNSKRQNDLLNGFAQTIDKKLQIKGCKQLRYFAVHINK